MFTLIIVKQVTLTELFWVLLLTSNALKKLVNKSAISAIQILSPNENPWLSDNQVPYD